MKRHKIPTRIEDDLHSLGYEVMDREEMMEILEGIKHRQELVRDFDEWFRQAG